MYNDELHVAAAVVFYLADSFRSEVPCHPISPGSITFICTATLQPHVQCEALALTVWICVCVELQEILWYTKWLNEWSGSSGKTALSAAAETFVIFSCLCRCICLYHCLYVSYAVSLTGCSDQRMDPICLSGWITCFVLTSVFLVDLFKCVSCVFLLRPVWVILCVVFMRSRLLFSEFAFATEWMESLVSKLNHIVFMRTSNSTHCLSVPVYWSWSVCVCLSLSLCQFLPWHISQYLCSSHWLVRGNSAETISRSSRASVHVFPV